ncbi:MAG: glucoamylase family protein [Phycisphaerae bacterium]
MTYRFSEADEKLLDEVQYACHRYFWDQVGSPSMLAKDRMKSPVSSIAAVGFQLSALPIAVERGWITRDQATERALVILRGQMARDDNKKFGVYLHFPDLDSGGISHHGFEICASTVDHSLFLAGVITAGQYFGGEVKKLADEIESNTNWKVFAVAENGYISMGWDSKDKNRIDGPGEFLKSHWWNAADEERLVYFLAVGATNPEHAVGPELYYKLKRPIGRHDNMQPFVMSWPGALFTYFFAHCWIDYRAFGADDPGAFGSKEPAVDWFENSRRAVLTQIRRSAEAGDQFKTFKAGFWGSAPAAAKEGYIVPMVKPNIADTDEWHEGTVAPYAVACSLMFAPKESMATLRKIRELQRDDGKPYVWRDPKEGGFGFCDSFCLDQNYAEEDYTGIDQGPMILAIENARTGLIWRLFMQSEMAKRAVERLKWKAIER